jgi:methylglutaconyl-CoA hydratase
MSPVADSPGGSGSTGGVQLERRAGVATITLARPEKKNALDRAMADGLRDALAAVERDESVRVVVLRGDGDDFCAGADLAALERMIDADPDAHRADAQALGDVFLAMRALSKPVVAVVQGRALAGGAGLASACDLVLAREDAQLGYPEVRVGFVPAMVMTMLRRAVGEKRAFDLVSTGRVIDAREAERMGLVSRVLPATTFESEVTAFVDGLAKSPPSALALTKRLFYQLDALSFADGIAAGVRGNVEARATEDFRSGVRRFTSKGRERGR